MNVILLKSALLGFVLLNFQCSQSHTPIKVLNVQEFKAKMNQLGENAILLDVRTTDEVNQGMLEGAVHLDFYQKDFKSKIISMDKNAPYFIYCGSGIRSNKTAKMMLDNGFTLLYDLEGGIGAWKNAGEPIN